MDENARALRSIDSCLNNDGFIMALVGKPAKYKHRYTGTDMDFPSWIIKCSYDSEDKEFELPDLAENALFLEHVVVLSISEYAANKMIISATPNELLLVENM